jgi:hypothetical protein
MAATTRTRAPAMTSLLVLPARGTRRERIGKTPRAITRPIVTQHCALTKRGRLGLRLCSRRMAAPGAEADQRITSVSSTTTIARPAGVNRISNRSS